MSTVLLQLKPREESFYEILFKKLERLDVVVLCEGRSDVEVAKSVFRKLASEIESTRVSMGFTNVEGRENIPYIAVVVFALSKLYRKLKSIVVVIDADEFSVEERVKSIIDSLRARGVQVEEFTRDSINPQVYTLSTVLNNRYLKLIVAVSGDFSLPTRKHVLEDHCVKLANRHVASGLDSARQLVEDIRECLKHIEESPVNSVCREFGHICRALEILLKNL